MRIMTYDCSGTQAGQHRLLHQGRDPNGAHRDQPARQARHVQGRRDRTRRLRRCAPRSRSPISSVPPARRYRASPCRTPEPSSAQGHVGDRALPHAALGGHVEGCEDCGHRRIAYNSCRNRHCPKCQGAAARTWLAEREADLLPVRILPRRLHPAGRGRRHRVPQQGARSTTCCSAQRTVRPLENREHRSVPGGRRRGCARTC